MGAQGRVNAIGKLFDQTGQLSLPQRLPHSLLIDVARHKPEGDVIRD